VRGLYAIADAAVLEARGIDVLQFCERVLAASPALLQLRAKAAAPSQTLAWLRALRPMCDRAGVPLVGNDRPDLARLAACDFVHVGQSDLDATSVRAVAPGLRIGISTHDDAQLAAALSESPDYVAFGPVFATTSKADPDPVVGLDGLARAAAIVRRRIPLVAIGGVDLTSAPRVAEHAGLGAVIGALLPERGLDGVTDRARALHRALGG
jgi:thiamine-phosphate pyrophosphorylase